MNELDPGRDRSREKQVVALERQPPPGKGRFYSHMGLFRPSRRLNACPKRGES